MKWGDFAAQVREYSAGARGVGLSYPSTPDHLDVTPCGLTGQRGGREGGQGKIGSLFLIFGAISGPSLDSIRFATHGRVIELIEPSDELSRSPRQASARFSEKPRSCSKPQPISVITEWALVMSRSA
jgi:hypothetical protein